MDTDASTAARAPDRAPVPAPGTQNRASVAERFSVAAELYAVSEQRAGDDLEAVVDAVVTATAGIASPVIIDVATGPGSTALAMAAALPQAGVTGTDVSEGMLATARRRAVEAGLTNVAFTASDAAALPAAAGSVDVVTSRIAPHHFPDIDAWLRESARVLRAGGTLVVLDSEAPEDPVVAAFLHDIEIARDPTHVRARSARDWVAAITHAGFTVREVGRYPKPKDFESWLARGGGAPDALDRVRAQVAAAEPTIAEELAIERGPDGAPTRFADQKVFVVAERIAAFSFVRIDHVQLAMPVGEEARAVAYFHGVLGLEQLPKPEPLARRGGCWFAAGAVVLHLGAEDDFRPARKAHPALVVDGIDALAARLVEAGHEVRWDRELPDVRRFHTDDCFGNRIEIVQAGV